MKKYLLTSFLVSIFFVTSVGPVFAQNQLPTKPVTPSSFSGLVNCGNKIVNGKIDPSDQCTFDKLVEMFKYIMKYALWLIMLAMVGVFVFMGFMYIKSQGNSAEVKKAWEMMKKMAIGVFWMLCAWIVVYTILSQLGNDKIDILRFFSKP
jgi:Na+/H+-dicarboxylate symporter